MTNADVGALQTVNKQLARLGENRAGANRDYYPLLDSDAYGIMH